MVQVKLTPHDEWKSQLCHIYLTGLYAAGNKMLLEINNLLHTLRMLTYKLVGGVNFVIVNR